MNQAATTAAWILAACASVVVVATIMIAIFAKPMASGPAPRVVALAPAVSQMVRALGYGHLIVGRHSFDAWTDQAIPVIGDQSGIDYDALVNVRPGIVLLQWGERELPPRLMQLGADQGWTVKNLPLLTLQDVHNAATWINEMVPGDYYAKRKPYQSPSFLEGIDAMKGDFSKAGRILILHTCSPPTVLGPGSYHHQLLERLGITPAVTEGKAYMTMDVEDVLRLDPDGIILVQPREVKKNSTPSVGEAKASPPPLKAASGEEASLEARLGRLGTVGLRAVKNGRVAVIDDPMALVPGLNLIDVAAEMKKIVEGWAR